MLFHNRRDPISISNIIDRFNILPGSTIAHLRWEKACQCLNQLAFSACPFKKWFRRRRNHRPCMSNSKCRLHNQDYNRTNPKLIAIGEQKTSQGRFANGSGKNCKRVEEALARAPGVAPPRNSRKSCRQPTKKKVGMEDHPCQFYVLPDKGPSMFSQGAA